MRVSPAALCATLALALAAASGAAAQDQETDLRRLHDVLRLRSDQEAAWRAYQKAVTPTAEMEARHRAADQLMPQIPTPRRIALMQATMAQDAADFARQGAAVNAFYAQLTPEQQRTFDSETLPSAQPER